MTARKGHRPKEAGLSAEQNEELEAMALKEINKLPTRAWQNMSAVWNMLPLMHPATRRRILRAFLELAHKRGHALSAKWVNRFAGHLINELDVSYSSRAAVHEEGKMREAARYYAHHPKASLADIAAEINGKKTTVRNWLKRQDFRAFNNDEMFLLRNEIVGHIQRKKEEEEEAKRNAQSN